MQTGVHEGCASWAEHDWSDPVVQASGYVPFRGWFWREATVCQRCGRRVVQERWTPKETRTLPMGMNGQE